MPQLRGVHQLVAIIFGQNHEQYREDFYPRTQSGGSFAQSIRFEGAEVRVSKVGNTIIPEPISSDSAMPWLLLDETGDSTFMPEGRDKPSMPLDRVQFL